MIPKKKYVIDSGYDHIKERAEMAARAGHEAQQSYVEDYAIWLDKHELLHTHELAAVYYNKRAHMLVDEMTTIEDHARLQPRYELLQQMSRTSYNLALVWAGELIKED